MQSLVAVKDGNTRDHFMGIIWNGDPMHAYSSPVEENSKGGTRGSIKPTNTHRAMRPLKTCSSSNPHL